MLAPPCNETVGALLLLLAGAAEIIEDAHAIPLRELISSRATAARARSAARS
jgi:hypothetical protein